MHEIAFEEIRDNWVGYVWSTITEESNQQYYWSLSYSGKLDGKASKDALFGSGCSVIPDSGYYETLEEAQRGLREEMDKHAPPVAERTGSAVGIGQMQ